jgi:all-trans-retinol 13,14-reductase
MDPLLRWRFPVNTRLLGTPYTQHHDDGPYDAVVIGSGIGGLGAAAALAKAGGLRVLVLERHHTAGGLTHAFHRPGFEWDVGLHYIGQVNGAGAAAGLFDYVTDGGVDWNAMPDAYDRVTIGDRRFDYVSGEARLRDALAGAFPQQRRAIDGYFRALSHCLRAMPFYYMEKALPPVVGRPLGRALRAPFVRYAAQTTGEVLARLGANQDLRAVLTAQWGNYGLPPGRSSFGIHAIVAGHYVDGAAYPIGGASRLARALLPVIAREGGAVLVGADVNRVVLCGARAIGVRLTDGREFRAPIVISDAGLVRTFTELLPERTPAVAALLDRVAAIEPSHAHLGLYVGVSSEKLAAPLPASNLWIHPTNDFDRNWAAFAADLEAPFPVLFISFPSAKDPSFEARYPGHQTIEVVVPVPYEPFAAWGRSSWKRRDRDYTALKERLQERLLAALERQVPGIGRAILVSELSTPLTTRHFVNAAHGEMYGLAHTPARFASRDLKPVTPVQGLYLTGQDVSTCGVAGALAGAVACASAVLRRNLFLTMSTAHARARIRAADPAVVSDALRRAG